MGLRGMAGEMARNTSGLWKGIADALDPDSRPAARPQGDIDLTEPHPSVSSDAPASPAGPSPGEHGGNMVVPLDTWTRILEQIGNVHEAGQQLAEARERAARAETENRFLREQLDDLKKQRSTATRSRPAATPPRPTSSRPASVATEAPEPETREPSAAAPVGARTQRPGVGARLGRARQRASDWLSPS